MVDGLRFMVDGSWFMG